MRPENHNTILAIEKLINVRILKKNTNNEDSEVYTFVDMLQMHLRYEANAVTEKSIGKDFKRLYKEGNAIIKARKKRKQGDNSGDKQNSNTNEKEDDDNNVQSSDSHDDNDNEGKNSESGEEEEENEDDDNDVHNSASEEEKKEEGEQGRTIFEV